MKHARAYVRLHGEKIPPEDVAREIELEASQLAKAGVDAAKIEAPNAFFRTLVKHATGRAKRRRKLVEQIAAGDDLQVITDDLALLDADLPSPAIESPADAKQARQTLDRLKDRLTPRVRLIFALLIEDDYIEEEVAKALSLRVDEIESAGELVEAAAREVGVEAKVGEGSIPPPATMPRERELRHLARAAWDAPRSGEHAGEPLLALLRDGDQSTDLDDAILHVANCPDCRAELTEGHVGERSVVVVAIEAPRASQSDLMKVANETHAKLLERGDGRYVAVVDASHAAELGDKLQSPDSQVVSRVAVSQPFEVPVEERTSRQSMRKSHPDITIESGTDAAEVQAWAQVALKPKQGESGLSARWTMFAVVVIGAAIAIAYFLATR
jgi:DNA-directed RNA polymerase specialized sigma24 family protein